MKRIFINYRRENSGGYVHLLRRSLIRHFPGELIFIDTDSIGMGEDFRDVIEKTWSTCEVVLAIIGKGWATVRDEVTDKLRLWSETDYVRLEIASALQKKIPIIPVLVGGAQMPAEGDLPPDIKLLAFRQAHEVSERHVDEDIESLVGVLKERLSTHDTPRVELLSETSELGFSTPKAELPIVMPAQMWELEKGIQEGGDLLIDPHNIAVLVNAVAAAEDDRTFPRIVLRNMIAGATYEYFYGGFDDNIAPVASFFSNITMAGLIPPNTPPRELSKIMQDNLHVLRENLYIMRENLRIHFRRRPPLEFCVHNALSEEAAICYLRHKQNFFVRWAEHREAKDIAAEAIDCCIAQQHCIFHSTLDFRLSEDKMLDPEANAKIRTRRQTLLRSLQKRFPPELHQDLNQVCLGS
ncbi:MAG: hypothetical protein WA655_21610 [Candidatus Korobacteraceae bacterium]